MSIIVKSGINGEVVRNEQFEHVVQSNEDLNNDFTELDVIEQIRCKYCGADDREDTLLICEQCGDSYHYDTCLSQPLPGVPEGDWFCSDCEHMWFPNGPTSN